MALVYLCEFYKLVEVAEYWRQVIVMNEHQKHRFSKMIYDTMNGTLAGKRIVLFGFAFKKNTEGTPSESTPEYSDNALDIRESPAIDVARVLLDERAEVIVYDPKVHLSSIHALGSFVCTHVNHFPHHELSSFRRAFHPSCPSSRPILGNG